MLGGLIVRRRTGVVFDGWVSRLTFGVSPMVDGGWWVNAMGLCPDEKACIQSNRFFANDSMPVTLSGQ